MTTDERDPAEDLWRTFHGAFGAAFHHVDVRTIARAWSTRERRTDWYARELLPMVAQVMGLEIGYEHLLVDYHFSTEREGVRVPVVFVESENEAWRAHEEVRKLAALAAPLRILMTVAEWDDTPGAWSHGGMRPQLLPGWRAIVGAHEAVVPRTGQTIALVAEWRQGVVRIFKERLSDARVLERRGQPWMREVGLPWTPTDEGDWRETGLR